MKGLVGNVTLYRRNYYSCFFFICTLNIILQLSTVKNLPFLVQVITEKAAETRIHLLMQGANGGDSGVYKCVPNNAPPAKIKVHILKGKQRMSCPNMLRFSITGPKWGTQIERFFALQRCLLYMYACHRAALYYAMLIWFFLLFFPYRKPGGWTADERRRRLPRVAAARGPEDALDLPFDPETLQLSGFSEALTLLFFCFALLSSESLSS